MSDRNLAWKDFYHLEQKYLDWLEDNSKRLYSIGSDTILYEDKYGSGLLRPQQYVRHVLLVDSLEIAEREFQPVKNAFILAKKETARDEIKESDIRFPLRFPRFFPSVQQFNISQNQAVKSIRIDSDSTEVYIQTYDYEDSQQAYEDMESMKLAGFSTAHLRDNRTFEVYTLTVNAAEFLIYFNAKVIQKRWVTGTQYIARVLYKDGLTQRYSFNLCLVEDPIQVYSTIPQKTRKHKLDSNDALPLPIKLRCHFFKKE